MGPVIKEGLVPLPRLELRRAVRAIGGEGGRSDAPVLPIGSPGVCSVITGKPVSLAKVEI